MRKWKRFLSVFFVLQFFTCSPLVGQTWAAPSPSVKAKTAVTSTKEAPQVAPAMTNTVTALSDQELKKYELPANQKKDWAQRLQWFESKIIDRYKAMNKKNILVVGEQKFLDVFKAATIKHNWNANFTYTNRANLPKINEVGHDLVIDTQYAPQHFKKIYGNLNVSSFKDVYSEILYDETLSFLEKNGVQYYFFEAPRPYKIKNLDEGDKRFSGETFHKCKSDILKNLYDNNQECYEYIKDGYNDKFKVKYNGRFCVLCDHNSKLYNVLNGERKTAFQKLTNYKNNIYFYGPCITRGGYVSDNYTIESYIQKALNNGLGGAYGVINCGVGGGADTINDFEYMLDTKFKSGDVVVNINLLYSSLQKAIEKHKFGHYELSGLFDRPHNYGHWLINNGFHVNHVGNEVIANYIYDVLKPQLSKSSPKDEQKTVKYQFENEVDTFLDDNPDFKRYLDGLKSIKVPTKTNGKVGSIVMNCNPFTLGHRYLIEQAAAQVDHLYIFVVEEDKSVFPFEDRMKLVKEGTADLGDKVTVLPSGKWIISLLTFPEYFNKDDLQGAAIDPSKDISLFGKYIAPTLGINMRFVGEEPFDKVTRQYNETMRNVLPSFGVSFQEIPRKATDGKDDVISATKVRNAIKAGDFENLKKYVPKTTLIYLKENYEQIVARINSKYKK